MTFPGISFLITCSKKILLLSYAWLLIWLHSYVNIIIKEAGNMTLPDISLLITCSKKVLLLLYNQTYE